MPAVDEYGEVEETKAGLQPQRLQKGVLRTEMGKEGGESRVVKKDGFKLRLDFWLLNWS